jgi:hypothetical protein
MNTREHSRIATVDECFLVRFRTAAWYRIVTLTSLTNSGCTTPYGVIDSSPQGIVEDVVS